MVMDVNELLQSLSGETDQVATNRSGESKAAPSGYNNAYVTRQEILELRRNLCELLRLLLNLHVTSALETEVPYMDIYLN
jgi:hypothetical protein